MNIYNYLKKDHQAVADLFEEILASKNVEKRESLFLELANELLIHADAENKTFYAALKDYKETAEIISHAKKEHKEVKDYIAGLKLLDVDSEKWLEQIGELKHSVTHHVKEEETDIFAKAKMVLSAEQANQLAQDMDKLKSDLKVEFND